MSWRRFLVMTSIGAVLSSAVVASDTQPAEIPTVMSTFAETQTAWNHWDLSETQWRRYEQLMQARRGLWSPGLDPIMALGVSTHDADERQRLAELYVRQQFERTRLELAFQVAVDAAWRRLYPHTSRLDANTGAAASGFQAERYALIVQTACPPCDTALEQRLPALLAQSQAGVDIHVVGTANEDAELRAWIADHPAIARALEQGQLTVNHGGSFAHLSRFPALFRKNGAKQWAREL